MHTNQAVYSKFNNDVSIYRSYPIGRVCNAMSKHPLAIKHDWLEILYVYTYIYRYIQGFIAGKIIKQLLVDFQAMLKKKQWVNICIFIHIYLYSWGDQDLSILIGLAKAYIYIYMYIHIYYILLIHIYIYINVSSSILTWWKSMEEIIQKNAGSSIAPWSPFGRDLSFLPLVCQVSHPRGTAPAVISALRRANRIFWTYQKIWKTLFLTMGTT